MKLKDKEKESYLVQYLTHGNRATLSREALEDRRLNANDLGFLLYVNNCIWENKFNIAIVHERFNRGRGYWRDQMKKMYEFGYAKLQKKQYPGQMIYIYLITDQPKMIERPDIFDTISIEKNKLQPVTPEALPVPIVKQDYVPQPKHYATKYLDPTRHSQEEMELAQYFMNYGFAIPKTDREWIEAKQPGIKAWTEVTETDLDWTQVRKVNRILKEPINHGVLETVFMEWTSLRFNKRNAKGILEWYELLCKDTDAKPWDRQYQKGNKKNDRYSNSRRQPSKEHGTSTVVLSDSDYESIE